MTTTHEPTQAATMGLLASLIADAVAAWREVCRVAALFREANKANARAERHATRHAIVAQVHMATIARLNQRIAVSRSRADIARFDAQDAITRAYDADSALNE